MPPLVSSLLLVVLLALAAPRDAVADDDPPAPEAWAFHAQTTFVDQANAAFRAPYGGPNSLDPHAEGRETWDVTAYVGFRPWRGAEVWIDPEIDQGFGLSNTLGVAGFPSGEAYKVGAVDPYFRLQRLFIRQTIDLGGARQAVDADLNQLAGGEAADRLVLTAGKLSVGDIFDANTYAHDPRHDFLNWSVIDAGTFDYAADAWGYTYGAAAELYAGRWALRAGVLDLSVVPNSTRLETDFRQFQLVGEVEERHRLGGRPGKIRITAFLSRGRMGSFADAVSLARATGGPADIAAVRRYQGRGGVSLDVEQQVAANLGVFARVGLADGKVESYEFTDIDRTLAAGVSLGGARWGRPGDTIALAGVINGASRDRERFLDAGGLGILVGDGRLPHPGPEAILEGYYDLAVIAHAHVTFDVQAIDNPGYNRDRGPAAIGAVRLHAQF